MDPEQLLRQAQSAIQRGADPAAVSERVRQLSGGRFASLAALQDSVGAGQGPSMAPGILGDTTAAQDASAAPGPRPDPRASLFQQAQRAIDQGADPEDVNERIANLTNDQFRTVEELNPDKSTFAGFGRVGRIAGEVGTFGFLDELSAGLRGLVSAAGALVPGGRSPGEAFSEDRRQELEASRERLRAAEAGAGPGTKVVGTVAGAFGPGSIGGRAVLRGSGALSRTARGAGVGAAEGAAFGAGQADPDSDLPFGESVVERVKATPKPAAIGGGLGLLLGNATGLLSARSASKGKPGIGPRLAGEIEETGGILGKPSRVRESVQARKRQISREQFKPLEELGEIDNQNLRRTLQRGDVGEVTERLFPELAEGSRPPTFLELQKVKDRIQGLKDKAVRDGDSFEVAKWGDALEDITEEIGDAVEGFGPAQAAWRREMDRIRALEEGRKLRPKALDDVQSAFDNLPDDPQIREAFREGLAVDLLSKLRDGRAMKTFLERVQTSQELQGKLKIILGGGDALERFKEVARQEQRGRLAAQDYESIARHFRRIGGGGGVAIGTGLAADEILTGGQIREGIGGILGIGGGN